MNETNSSIQLFTPTYRIDECLAEIRETLEVGWTGLGYKTLEFEHSWLEFTGLKHAHFVNSATAALHLSLQAMKIKYGWEDGDEVITTPLTFVSTNHVILQSGLEPVFADIDQYLCIDPEEVVRLYSNKTKAVIFVGLGGSVGQLEKVVEIARDLNIKVILDAAHMSGTTLRGLDPGNIVDAACYSFQAVKNLPTADSGMVCFADGELDALARKLSWLGIDRDTYTRANAGNYAWMYSVEQTGFKYNGNSIMASLALVGLRYLVQDNQRRREISEVYSSAIRDLPGIELIPTVEHSVSAQHLFQIRIENRNEAIKHFHAHDIYPGVHYRLSTDYPMYRNRKGSWLRANKASNELLSLPLHLRLSASDVDRVIHALNNFFRIGSIDE